MRRAIASALLALGTLILLGATGLAQLKVSVMPSYTQAITYGNAELNVPITVWGRAWGGTGAHTYVLDFGDGTSASGAVADLAFIGASKAYTSSGSKTITLTVTDGNGVVASRSAVVRVLAAPTHQERVNMAIEKALLWLYRNPVQVSADQQQWPWGAGGGINNDDFSYATTAAAVIAFEENGHLPSNSWESDPYAESVQRALNYLVTRGGYMAITPHSDGIEVRDSDSNGNGKGAYLIAASHETYAGGFGALAIILSKRNAAEAQAALITSGPFAGESYYSLITDVIDLFSYAQGDGARRGGWVYQIRTTDNGRYDGSAQQWPCLTFRAAKDLWGLSAQQWAIDNAVYGFKVLQNPTSGGVGYDSSNSWRNIAKTGGMLSALTLGNKFAGSDADANLAMTFVGNSWMNYGSWSNDQAGWTATWYAMYGIKKGLQLQGVETINTPNGPRSWYRDLSAWLLGNAALLDSQGTAQIAPAHRSLNYMFGQHPDGRWTAGEYPNDLGRMDTAHGVLILTQAVTNPPPVAVIAAVGEQNTRNPAFQMDGSGSHHLDPAKSIVQYLWDWDASNGVDWENPDATGSRPTNPGYSAIGNYTVTLMVRDNSVPTPMTATTTVVISVIDTDIAPVAVSLPPGHPPYAGKVGEEIQLDGSASYDPDGDEITLYSWDTNGDGVFGDAFGVSPTVVFNAPRTGQVGLRVTANGKTSSNNTFIDIYTSENDLMVAGVSISNINVGNSATARVELRVHPDSTEAVYSDVVVRFYAGDPLLNGSQLGGSYVVTLTRGQPFFLDANLTNLAGATDLAVYVDANRAIAEWDEGNNILPFRVAQLFKNPEFTDGNTEFQSGHTFTGEPSTTPGAYTVADNPQDLDPALASFGDHTTGNGPMLIVNSGGPGTYVYEQTVEVEPMTWYAFSFWAASASPTNPAILTASGNSQVFAETLALPATPGVWAKFQAYWFSGGATTGTFRINDIQTATAGNDFAIDDLLLIPVPGPGAPITSLFAWKGMAVPGAGTDPRIPAESAFYSFGVPAINAAGQVAFYATWRSPSALGAGIFAGNPVALVAAKGELPAGFPAGSRFTSFNDPVMNEEGKVAFTATVGGVGVLRSADVGIWTNALDPAGALELLFREDGAVPGVADARFNAPSSIALQGKEVLVNAAMELGLAGAPGPGGVTKANDRGVWSYRAGLPPALLIREGQPMTVGGAPKTVKLFKMLVTMRGTGGHGRFQTQEGAPGTGNFHALQVSFTDGTQGVIGNALVPAGGPLAFTGGAPESLPGAQFHRFGVPSFGFVGDGGFVYAATLKNGLGEVSSSNNSGLFQGLGQLIARRGDVAPGASGPLFASFKDPVGNTRGDAAFLATLSGAGTTNLTNQGIWWRRSASAAATTSLVARESGEPTGVPAAEIADFTSLALPDGPVGPLLVAKLRTGSRGSAGPGGVTAASDVGLWAIDAFENNHLVTREGNYVFGKAIRNFTVLATVKGSQGQPRSFNNAGQLIYRAVHTDGSQAIFKVQMPVPALPE